MSLVTLIVTSNVPPVSCLPATYFEIKSSMALASICSVDNEIPPIALILDNAVTDVGICFGKLVTSALYATTMPNVDIPAKAISTTSF